MVGDNKQQDNSVELEASLAPAEAEVGAVAKADQYFSPKEKPPRLVLPLTWSELETQLCTQEPSIAI